MIPCFLDKETQRGEKKNTRHVWGVTLQGINISPVISIDKAYLKMIFRTSPGGIC